MCYNKGLLTVFCKGGTVILGGSNNGLPVQTPGAVCFCLRTCWLHNFGVKTRAGRVCGCMPNYRKLKSHVQIGFFAPMDSFGGVRRKQQQQFGIRPIWPHTTIVGHVIYL